MCPSSVSVNVSCARGPDDPHVNPIGGGLGRLPTMPPIGFSCALKGSCCQQRGPAASTATTTDITAPKTQTTSPTTPHFQRFSPKWSAFWAPHHPKLPPHSLKTGGIARHEAPTRRRHAARGLHVVQNPTATSMEGTGGTAGPGRGARGRWDLVGQRANAPIEASSADGRSGRHRHHRQPNFARNLSRSFFEMPQKRWNSGVIG